MNYHTFIPPICLVTGKYMHIVWNITRPFAIWNISCTICKNKMWYGTEPKLYGAQNSVQGTILCIAVAWLHTYFMSGVKPFNIRMKILQVWL
jgi:hypothetical protein